MLFHSLIQQVEKAPFSIQIPADWSQGRAAFGGAVAALVYEQMQLQVAADLPVRSLQVSFIGPVSSESFEIESQVLRQGKSVAQVFGQGKQNGQSQVAILGSFGRSRSSSISVAGETTIFPEDPLSIEPMPYVSGVFPEFTRHFDIRFCTGMPFSESEGDTLRGFVRFKDAQEIGMAEILALVDAWPPAVLPRLKEPAPASSLSWNVEFVQPMPSLTASEFCQYQADIMYADDGYACIRAKVWNSKGELLVTSQQMVVAFA